MQDIVGMTGKQKMVCCDKQGALDVQNLLSISAKYWGDEQQQLR